MGGAGRAAGESTLFSPGPSAEIATPVLTLEMLDTRYVLDTKYT